jgi:ribosomal protein S18 acetylase RimI-like enzyme
MSEPDVRPLDAASATVEALSRLLIETVAGGGSVSFMHPLAPEAAARFWGRWLASAAKGERVVVGAFVAGELAGTVTLVLDCPPNQPHRAEIAKMMTATRYRGQGVGSALLARAEAIAAERGRTLINLDTASEEGASAFYERNGYVFAGEIPDYALKPHGGLTGTRLYWKRLDQERLAAPSCA